MSELCIVGGQQKYLRPLLADDSNWYEYHKGVIIRFDTEDQNSEMSVEYTSPSELGTATLFKSATSHGDQLFVCSQTEVLIYSLPSFQQVNYITLPCFNDVHHVRLLPNGKLAIALAGLDMVVEVSTAGKIDRQWDVTGAQPWTRFSKEMDYRLVNTKPHKAHPNSLFLYGEELWALRFYQRDAICLTDPDKRIEIAIGAPHDGVVHGNLVFFTTVNGYVVVANLDTLKIEQVFNLNEMHDYGAPLGWCRGILIDEDTMWVGFSRIRPTKLRENVEWITRSLKSTIRPMLPSKIATNSKWLNSRLKRELPTHIARYHLRDKKCIDEWNLEVHGISAIFSILPGSDIFMPKLSSAYSENMELRSSA